ncbi:MAG: hypothetical protein J5565_01015 [Muribaculaceae bacterium]|nr:hypothetical protein [Muribaculaceae bacterium]
MWAASGQARHGGRWLIVSDIGLRLAVVPGIEVASRFDTLHFSTDNPRIRLFRSLPLRPVPQSVIESACACGFGSLSTALQEHIRLSPLHRGSASQVPLTPDCCSLLKPNAQQVVLQRLMAYHGTLNAFNRLVLHSRPLQARCFAAAASRVVGGLRLLGVLHYATCTPSSSPPFEHLPASP